MGNRLSKIYTRTGDDGTTGLGDGSRVAKTHPRVQAMGDVDELNSVIGLLQTESLPAQIVECLIGVQHTLFDIGGELAVPGYKMVDDDRVTRLETLLDELNASLSPLKEFILPGGSRAGATCHLARSVCRRAERTLHDSAQTIEINDAACRYINRLSDLLFVMARSLNAADGHADVLWKHDRQKPA
jgi:cob(I)alamin adenosyltransferase